jgi:LuxR family maltose regulon positive regulatory protein
MTTPILKTKLYIPQPRRSLVARPRLVERLDEGTTQGRRLTLVSAPAGAGKTTLLSEWIARTQVRTAWLSLDPEDDDAVRFWTYVIAALRNAHSGSRPPDGNALGQASLQALGSPQLPPARFLLSPLINELAALAQTLLLVLDDYHVISSRSIHDGISFLLDHQPERLHLVIATRADPPLPIARLRASGLLTEMRGVDLRFSSDETGTLLNDVMSLNLPPDDVKALESRTEGWVAGLHLAALSIGKHANPRQFIANFTGSQQFVLEYLVEEVLSHQSEQTRRFLLQTSILDRLCPSLCDAVAEADGGEALLEQLRRDNLFVVPLGDQRVWYRYHRLFADLLTAQLRKTLSKQRILELNNRASEWHEDNGSIDEAVKYALRAQDYQRVARLAEEAAKASMLDSRMTTLVHWADALPEEVLQTRPRLRLYQAWALFLNGQIELSSQMLQDARRALADPSGLPEATEAREELTNLLDTMELISSGMFHCIDGELERATLDLGKGKERALAAGHVFLATLATEGLALAQYHQGRLRQSAKTCREVIRLADRHAGAGPAQAPLAASGYIELSGAHLEWNQLDSAADCIEKALELCHRMGSTQTLVEAYTAQSRYRQALGDIDGALEAIQQARDVGQAQSPYTLANFRVYAQQARLDLVMGRAADAARWAQQLGTAFTRVTMGRSLPLSMRDTVSTILARSHLAENRPKDALAILDPVGAAAEAGGRYRRVAEVCLLKALALHAEGKFAAALKELQYSLTLAEPEGYVRTYLDEGTAAARLLTAFCQDPSFASSLRRYARTLLEAFEADKARREHPEKRVAAETRSQPSIAEPLTKRELEVLQLIAQGCSNQEIADTLVLALNTVKRHTSNIYGKLGVSSRTQAVARARDLGLLPLAS